MKEIHDWIKLMEKAKGMGLTVDQVRKAIHELEDVYE